MTQIKYTPRELEPGLTLTSTIIAGLFRGFREVEGERDRLRAVLQDIANQKPSEWQGGFMKWAQEIAKTAIAKAEKVEDPERSRREEK